MTLKEIQARLQKLMDRGFIPSLRRGPTGVGHTLEKELGLEETNIRIPDIGGRVELKASRRDSASLITLFTFNKGVWQIPQKSVIEEYGYVDVKGRKALYATLWFNSENAQGLSIDISMEENRINLIHYNSGKLIASWDAYSLVGIFLTKLERLILVTADSKTLENKKEAFHYTEAFLLYESTPRNFLESFKNSKIAIDIRMHLKENETVRNHGTGIRIRESDISSLYKNRKQLL